MKIDEVGNIDDLKKIKNVDEIELTVEQKKEFTKLAKEAEKFFGKDESEMMNELKLIAHHQKNTSKISDEKLDKFTELLTPLLDKTQKNRLNQIINTMKEK